MKLLTPLLLCFLCLLTGAKPYGETNLPGNRDHTGDGRTYTYSDTRVSNNGRNVENVHSSFTDNSIHRNNANFEGASNVVIGNNKIPDGVFPQTNWGKPEKDNKQRQTQQEKPTIAGNRDHTGDGRTYTYSDTRVFNNGRNVENVQHSYTDNSIHRNNANFEGASNVVIGSNNVPDGVFPQHTGAGLDRSSQGSGTQYYRNDGRTYTASDSRSGPNGNTRNVQTSYTDNTIRRHGANFDGARNVVIGHNQQLPSRMAASQMNYDNRTQGQTNQPRYPRDTHIQQTDNSINLKDFQLHGSVQMIVGHGKRNKRNVTEQEAEEQGAGEEAASRQKRWGVGVKSKVRNEQTTSTDNSINMDDANFAGSQNVIIGHGNRAIKRSVPVEEPQEGEELSRQKRWGTVKVNSEVKNTQSTRTDNSIKMHNADFQRSTNVVIGHGNKVSKRSLDAALQEDGTETEEKLLREKRWGVEVDSTVQNIRSEHKDNSIKMHEANFQQAQHVVIGHGNELGKRKRSVDPLDGPEAAETDELSRQKRWGGVKVNSDVENIHSTHTDNSINMHGANFKGANFVVIGHGNELGKGKRSVDASEYNENQEHVRVKRKFFGSVAIHDMRTRPGPPVSLDNLEGSGSVHVVIYDNTDPVTLKGAKITGSAQLIIH